MDAHQPQKKQTTSFNITQLKGRVWEGLNGHGMKVTNMNKGRGEGNYAPQIRESIPTAKSERGRADAGGRVHNRQTFLTALVAAAAGRSGANIMPSLTPLEKRTQV